MDISKDKGIKNFYHSEKNISFTNARMLQQETFL